MATWPPPSAPPQGGSQTSTSPTPTAACPGDGTIDFPAVLSAALDTGYTGAFALETLCLPSREYVLTQEAAALRGALERRQNADAMRERRNPIMINIGIIGAGRIGQVHAKSILTGVPDARVLAIADPYLSEQAEAFARNAGIEGIYRDHHQILDDPRIDAVLICSSTDTHAPISIEAIQAGKHVFCEKPVDHSLQKIAEVQAALEASPKKLCYQVGFNRRFDHNYRAVRSAVADGRIGKLQFVRISSRDPEPPPVGYIKVSGGIFMDMMIHDIDMLRYLSGEEVEEVYAAARGADRPGHRRGGRRGFRDRFGKACKRRARADRQLPQGRLRLRSARPKRSARAAACNAATTRPPRPCCPRWTA